jgi:hypothetical protein
VLEKVRLEPFSVPDAFVPSSHCIVTWQPFWSKVHEWGGQFPLTFQVPETLGHLPPAALPESPPHAVTHFTPRMVTAAHNAPVTSLMF